MILVAVSTALALLLRWMRFPGGLMFGAMVGSAILHGTGWVHAVLPWWVGGGAVIVHRRGHRLALRQHRAGAPLLDYLGAALGSFAVAITVAALFVRWSCCCCRSVPPT